jgi:hypothetical protein
MNTSKIKFIFVFLLIGGFTITGCGDVSFQPIDVAEKGRSGINDEFPDPDDPEDPRPEQPEEPDEPEQPEEPDEPEQPEEPDEPEEPEQPNPEPTTETQVFQQNSSGGKVDILIVVDNSDSMMMDHSRHKIRNMFRGFLASLNNVDYQLGFTTTDMTTMRFPATNRNFPGWNGRLDVLEGTNQKILTSTTANKQSLFLNTIDREEAVDCRDQVRDDDPTLPCGTNTEEPLKSIMSFVDRRNAFNSGFFRSDADFVSIVISDEDERSKGSEDPQATTAQQVIDHVNSAFSSQKNYTNYSVVIEPGDRDCKRKQACSEFLCLGGGEYGRFATQLANLTSGRTASICSNDVTSNLSDIGDRGRAGGLFEKVTLQYEPLNGNVQVLFNPSTDIGYSINGRDVVFERKPPAGTEITVVYERQ